MVSVIIPIYNIAEYLPACFDSLIKQSNADFEVIMVNDGSIDNSEEICRQYEKTDPRFKLFNKSNGGVSSARNLGLRHSKGEWIAFVDGDDIVDGDYLTLPDDQGCIDVIEKSYYIRSGQDVIYSNVIAQDSLIKSNKSLLEYYSIHILSNSAALWNKIIKRSVIGDTVFDTAKSMGEDFIFFVSIISRIQEYYRMSLGAYYYLRRETSASKNVEADRAKGIEISFANIKSVKKITRSSSIRELGDNLVYARYLPSLLSLEKYLKYRDWVRLFILWILFPFAKKRLLSRRQRHSTLVEFPKAVIKSIIE